MRCKACRGSLAARRYAAQESHGEPVQSLAFNHADPALGNLFATVGADQVRPGTGRCSLMRSSCCAHLATVLLLLISSGHCV